MISNDCHSCNIDTLQTFNLQRKEPWVLWNDYISWWLLWCVAVEYNRHCCTTGLQLIPEIKTTASTVKKSVQIPNHRSCECLHSWLAKIKLVNFATISLSQFQKSIQHAFLWVYQNIIQTSQRPFFSMTSRTGLDKTCHKNWLNHTVDLHQKLDINETFTRVKGKQVLWYCLWHGFDLHQSY